MKNNNIINHIYKNNIYYIINNTSGIKTSREESSIGSKTISESTNKEENLKTCNLLFLL